MEHHTTTSRAEAERLLGIAEKLLRSKDFNGSRDFAILAQETEPLLDGSDQILAVAEVLLADNNNNSNKQQHDWYSILQIPSKSSNDAELIKKQYRRLALLLHPDKNKFPFADSAFRLVADAWSVLSDPGKKSLFDIESVPRFTKVDLGSAANKKQFRPSKSNKDSILNQKLPIRRNGNISNNNNSSMGSSFWTACPYCYNLYEYPRGYEGCCLRCENEKCRKAFTGAEILSMPPVVEGKEAYYCCWGVFPMGFRSGGGGDQGFPKWMPPMFGGDGGSVGEDGGAPPPPPPPAPAVPAAPVVPAPVNVTPVAAQANVGSTDKKKRGRPRKNW